jgi:hypothetical protein
MHRRRNILEFLATRLRTLSGYSVVRIQRAGSSRLAYPYITLYAESEECKTLTVHPQPRPQDRALIVSVNVWIRGTVDDEKPETDMDNAAVDVESVMSKPTIADDIELIATDFAVAEDEPEIHVVTLTYRVVYTSTEYSLTV